MEHGLYKYLTKRPWAVGAVWVTVISRRSRTKKIASSHLRICNIIVIWCSQIIIIVIIIKENLYQEPAWHLSEMMTRQDGVCRFVVALLIALMTLPNVEAINDDPNVNDLPLLRGGQQRRLKRPTSSPTPAPNGVCEHDFNIFCHDSNNGSDCEVGSCSSNSDNAGAACYYDSMCQPNSGPQNARGKCENIQAGNCISNVSPTDPPTPEPTPQPSPRYMTSAM